MAGGVRGDESKPQVELRPITMADMRAALAQAGASVAQDATSISELRQWNDLYGEGGSRRTTALSYFT